MGKGGSLCENLLEHLGFVEIYEQMWEFVGHTRSCSAFMIKAQLMVLIRSLHSADEHDRSCGGGVTHSQKKQ